MSKTHGLLFSFASAVLFSIALYGQNSEQTAVLHEKVIDYLHNPPLDLADFIPAKDQAGMDGILAAVGDNVSKLFANLLNISALERVQLENLGREGDADRSRKFDYLYLCMGAVEKSEPVFDEYRSDAKGHEVSQLGLEKGYMLTSGFVSAPLLFHPVHQNGSTFRLLGHQNLRGHDTIVMAFAQLPNRTRLSAHFQNGKDVRTTYKQGMVWIDAENYQIVRFISDLLTPVPEIRLEKLETQIDFGRIQFGGKAPPFWLPVRVVVTVHWNGKALRNTHVYSDFKAFNVEASQKIARPAGAASAVEVPEDTYLPKKSP